MDHRAAENLSREADDVSTKRPGGKHFYPRGIALAGKEGWTCAEKDVQVQSHTVDDDDDENAVAVLRSGKKQALKQDMNVTLRVRRRSSRSKW